MKNVKTLVLIALLACLCCLSLVACVNVAKMSGIRVDVTEAKTTYFVGEEVDFSGIKVFATYDDGTEKEIALADVTISDVDTSKAGAKKATVTYQNVTAYVTVFVEEVPTVTEVSVVGAEAKTRYFLGDAFDDTGMSLQVTWSNGKTETLSVSAAEMTGFDTTEAGSKVVYFTYEGVRGAWDITVKDPDAQAGLRLDTTAMTKTGIVLGTKPDYTGLHVFVSDDLGVETEILEGYTISGDEPAVPGPCTVTVTYQTYTAQFSVTFVAPPVAMDSFSLPAFVGAFTATTSLSHDSEGGFASAITYRVGDDNGFIFKPVATVVVGQDLVPVNEFDTTFRLFENDVEITGEALGALVSYTPATFTYDFTEAAVGHAYTLKVAPRNTTKSFDPVSFTFRVEDGWNAYTPADLSRMANSDWDVKVGGTVFNEKTAWDAYKLSHGVTKADGSVDDTPIAGIILHTSFALTDADFPAAFFVTAAEDPTGEAVGHIKDRVYGYHVLLSGDHNAFALWGNGFSLNIGALSTIYHSEGHQWGYGDDYSNTNLIKVDGQNADKAYAGGTYVTISDLSIVGNAKRTNDTAELIDDLGGMIGIKLTGVTGYVYNTIVTRSFIGMMTDYNTEAEVRGLKVYDSLQDAFFMWGGSTVRLSGSKFDRAGGPLIVMQHNDPTEDGFEKRIPELIVDDATALSNYVNGQEVWFQNNEATLYAQQIIGLDAALQSVATGYNGALSQYSIPTFTAKTYLNADGYMDFVTLMMSNGVSVDTAAAGAQGKTSIGGQVVSSTMADSPERALRARLKAHFMGLGVPEADAEKNANAAIIIENSNGQMMWTDGDTLYLVTAENPALVIGNESIGAEIMGMATGGATPIRDFLSTGDFLSIYAFGMAIVVAYH